VKRLPFVAASGTTVHCIWSEYRNGNWEIYYKRNPTGNFTSIESNVPELPEKFNLVQNYPNPFNPSTTIRYTIPNVTLSGVEGSRVQLKVYDILGNEIATLVNEEKPAGSYEVNFNASQLSSGIYFYKLQAGSFVETKKMMLLK
jgi:Secretion system C-terminal sorting domain